MGRLRPYLEHGILELDNNAAERAMRAIALGRKNYLFVGSAAGGKAAAIAYTLIETAKLNGVDPQAWLADTLARIPDYKITKVDELLALALPARSGQTGRLHRASATRWRCPRRAARGSGRPCCRAERARAGRRPSCGGRPRAGARAAAARRGERNVLEDGHVPEERVVLEDEPHAAMTHAVERRILSVEVDRPGIRRFQAGNDSEQRRLAGPGRSEQRDAVPSTSRSTSSSATNDPKRLPTRLMPMLMGLPRNRRNWGERGAVRTHALSTRPGSWPRW